MNAKRFSVAAFKRERVLDLLEGRRHATALRALKDLLSSAKARGFSKSEVKLWLLHGAISVVEDGDEVIFRSLYADDWDVDEYDWF